MSFDGVNCVRMHCCLKQKAGPSFPCSVSLLMPSGVEFSLTLWPLCDRLISCFCCVRLGFSFFCLEEDLLQTKQTCGPFSGIFSCLVLDLLWKQSVFRNYDQES